MLQDGIVARYLDEHCPDKRLRLCAHRHELPNDADVFFWSGDGIVFNRLGRFAGLGDEMGLIVGESLRAYPAWQLQAAAVATLRQLVRVSTGEGVVDHRLAHLRHDREIHAARGRPPCARAAAARRARTSPRSTAIHKPVALAAMLLLRAADALGRAAPVDDRSRQACRRPRPARCSPTPWSAACFANPHDRYGARLVWLAPLVVGLAALRLYEQRRNAPAGQLQPDAIPGSTVP